jgi:hypothetical protein
VIRREKKNRKLVTHSNPLPQYTKRTIWNYTIGSMQQLAIVHIYILLSRGVNEDERKEKKERLFSWIRAKKEKKKKRRNMMSTSTLSLRRRSVVLIFSRNQLRIYTSRMLSRGQTKYVWMP